MRRTISLPRQVSDVTEAFLSQLVSELDTELVTALIVGGSVARSEETPFSDIDLARFVKQSPEQKYYTYRQGRLISVVTRTIEHVREQFSRPEEAIFVVPAIREARPLIDNEGAFKALQQEAWSWRWEPLQSAANTYAGHIMMIYSEYVHKILRALLLQENEALSEMVFGVLHAVTEAMATQQGILAQSGNSYFHQVQEHVGIASPWTSYHRRIADLDQSDTSLEGKGIAALRLYQETARLLLPTFETMHREVVEQTVQIIEEALVPPN